jgi:hypothetical protein
MRSWNPYGRLVMVAMVRASYVTEHSGCLIRVDICKTADECRRQISRLQVWCTTNSVWCPTGLNRK